MPRIVREARLQERTARARLAPRHHPYWRAISQGRHLGYYKGRLSCCWIARCFDPNERKYLTKALGAADDQFASDGASILDWNEALDQALEWFDTLAANQYKRADNYTV